MCGIRRGLGCRQEDGARDGLRVLVIGECLSMLYHRAPVFFLLFTGEPLSSGERAHLVLVAACRREEEDAGVANYGGHDGAKQKDGRLPAHLSATDSAESSVFRLLVPLVVFLARLAVLALQRGAEDVTEAGARIGGAVIGHRLLLLLDLARLDREAELARRRVDRRHLGVDLLADGEAVGALLAAVARQIRLADEARHAVADRDLDAAIADRRHGAGDDRAFLQHLQRRFMRVDGELLDAEADALLLDIDVQHLDLEHVALVVVGNRLLARLAPIEVGQMDHAVDVAGQADEEAELGDVLDLALELAADRVFLDERAPRIGQGLLEAEADAPLLRIDIEHHDLDLLAGRDDLAGMDVLLGPRHLRDVDETLDAGLQLDEGAVIGDVGDAAGELGAGRVFELDALPRIGLELLHAERDALRLGVEADDLHLDRLADMQRLGRVVDAPPGDVGDVEQPVDAAEIDEGAVIGDVLDHAGEDLALLERGDQLGALLGPAFFQHGAARHHDIAARAVHLEDLEGLRRAEQGRDVAHRADIDLAARQEGAGAVEIDGEAALDAAEDDAGDALVALERLLEQGPGLLAARLLARELRLAVLVLHPLEEDLDGVADLDVRLVAGRLAGGSEFLEIDAAFRFEADIDEDRIILDREDAALDDGAFEAARPSQGFVQ